MRAAKRKSGHSTGSNGFQKEIFYIHTYMYVWLCISGGVGEKPGTTHIHAKAALAHFFLHNFLCSRSQCRHFSFSKPNYRILLCENIFKICFKPTHNRQTHIATQTHTLRHTYTYTQPYKRSPIHILYACKNPIVRGRV